MLHDDGMPGMGEVLGPILEICADGNVHDNSTLTYEVAEWFKLTPEQRRETTQEDNGPKISNRTSRAVSHLCHAELLKRPTRGRVEITEAGTERVEAGNASDIRLRDLKKIPAYAKWEHTFKSRRRNRR